MSKVTIATACALAFVGTFSTGCLSMRLANAPEGQSFENPPVREVVAPFPKETIVGKWRAKSVENYFMKGKRACVNETTEELELNQEGTCTMTITKTITEDHLGVGYGPGGHNKEKQVVCEGSWKYTDNVLALDLSTDVKMGFFSRTVKLALEHTVAWHSDNEFSYRDTDEQFNLNARTLGGLGWDSRKVEPNGVETYKKKGTLTNPEQMAVAYTAPYKRIEDSEE